MIKFLRGLRQYRTLIFVILFVPVIPMFFTKKLKFQIAPASPYEEFNVEITTPQKNAQEISLKVAQVAERNFNGISGLISLSSLSEDEKALVKLKFDRTISPNSAYLLIQEKLDRIKLELPSSVEKINVIHLDAFENEPNDLEVYFHKAPSIALLQKTLRPHFRDIAKLGPNIFLPNNFRLKLDLEALQRFQIPLSQILNAIKVNGFKGSIGQQEQIFFGIGDSFKSVEDVYGIMVSAVGHRPILVRDIGKLEIQSVEIPGNVLQIKLNNPDAIESIQDELLVAFGNEIRTIERPLSKFIRAAVFKFAIVFAITIAFQFILQKVFFGLESRFFVTFLFNVLIVCHYAFWKSILGGLNLFDIDVLSLAEGIGNILWFIVLIRIRSYFLPQVKVRKIPRSLEQATLMTMGELLPAFATFYIVLWLLGLPMIQNSVNLPSSYILSQLISVGLPIVLFLIVVLPIVESSRWITAAKTNRVLAFDWNFTPRLLQISFYCSLILLVSLPLCFLFQKWGLNISAESDLARSYRGYGQFFEYLTPINDPAAITSETIAGNKPKLYHNYQFTPIGLKHLPKLDLQSFLYAIKETNLGGQWGYFDSAGISSPLSVIADLRNSNILDLYIHSPDGKPVQLRNLVSESFAFENSQVYREKMYPYLLLKGSQANLKSNQDQTPTLWTEYLQKQIQNHHIDYVIYAVFIYLILAIYLNSFIRSVLMMSYLLLIMSLNISLRFILPWPFHVDSLWLLPLGSSVLFLILLVQTRILDVERARGTDRDDCLADLKEQMLTPFSFVAVPFIFSMFAKAFVTSSGFWKEGSTLAVFSLLGLYLLNRYLFPMFYLEAEEFIEKKIYNTFLLWRRFREGTFAPPTEQHRKK